MIKSSQVQWRGIMLKDNDKNIVKKGEIIFSEGDNLTQVGIVLSGKILMQNKWIKLVRPKGSYISLNDIDSEHYKATYTALEDSVIYALPVKGINSLHDIFSKSTDFRAIMISSQFRAAVEMQSVRKSLEDRCHRIFSFVKKSYEEYGKLCMATGISQLYIDEIENLCPFESENVSIDEARVRYFAEAARIPLAANKQYFSYSEEMVNIQVTEIMAYMVEYKDDCAAMTEYIKDILQLVCFKPNYNFFDIVCAKGQEMRNIGEVPNEMGVLLSNIIAETNFQYKELSKYVDSLPVLNVDSMVKKVNSVVSKNMTAEEKKQHEDKEEAIKRDIISLKNSLDQILNYCSFNETEAESLKNSMNHIVNVSDRLSVEDDVKKAKKNITALFFKVYLACYKKVREGLVTAPKAVKLFLDYGFMDERLLDEEHLDFLCRIEREPNEGPCNVYTMTEWLDLIMQGQRDPSKSEFDEDYIENLRSLRKQGEITEEQQKLMLKDMDRRVEYEVMNMQMSNTRSIYGQISTYMPVLYKEAIFGYLDNILVTSKKINDSVKKLLKIDYSAFYREVIYSNNALKIINETVMKNVYPDVILFPVFGINASMWQEVGGKNKGTPARFCFPAFTNGNIDDMMVKVVGRFRWELCRCIQGMAWNDVKVKSLTSEYMDYIQFYRKNRDLSDEAREKVKLQIQKGRNNSREVFLIDYEAWIKNEANGSMKMNKFARELLATYCPFEKTIREKLGAQRPYEIAMARYIRNAQKKKQEFVQKIKSIQRNTQDIPEEIMDTYKFYADM